MTDMIAKARLKNSGFEIPSLSEQHSLPSIVPRQLGSEPSVHRPVEVSFTVCLVRVPLHFVNIVFRMPFFATSEHRRRV